MKDNRGEEEDRGEASRDREEEPGVQGGGHQLPEKQSNRHQHQHHNVHIIIVTAHVNNSGVN